MPDPVPQGEGCPTETSTIQTPSSSTADEGRFLPGTVLAQRYRIISLLGRGGMGEVYRATDLLLGQPVALKFLPPATGRDEAVLSRFRNEVRVARQVSHPNVCRVYDIGEAEGLMFLTMEYVDGEDLDSLLRRIGHLPGDKALEIVRKLCAGLAAAHDKGVIHRDLKPSNIMLDGHGQVRVMDFGLAEFAGHVRDVRSGTPAYLAPEQKAGREVTQSSDIYSLGVVVHEVFTGKRPSEKASSKVELEPAVAAVIERCLAADPRRRPRSALAVAAALPGGDPLAAALAAGDTPSPEMVANAGPVEGMSVPMSVLCLGLLLVGIAAAYLAHAKHTVIEMSQALESPEVLAGRAREYIRSFGYHEPPKDTAMGWAYNRRFLAQLWKQESVADRPGVLRTLQPPAITFWFRQHPWGLYSFQGPAVTRTDPWFMPGSIEVVLDPQGRLVELHAAVGPRTPDQPDSPPDWNKLFAAAGLDLAKFQAVQPQFVPRTACDWRQAWKGVYPASPATEVRVEAAAFEGRLSSFRVVAPSSYQAAGPPDPGRVTWILVFAVIVPLWAAVMAWRNALQKRADWNGALRLGLCAFAAIGVKGLLESHHMAAMEGPVLWKVLREASFSLVTFAVLYLAFEPYVRRRMPRTLISWSRLLEGRWRDALAGSDILIGLAATASGLVWLLMITGQQLRAQPEPAVSGSAWLAAALDTLVYSGGGGLSFLLMLALLRLLLRRTWLAAVVLAAVLSLAYGGPPTTLDFLRTATTTSGLCLLLARFGLVAAMTALFAFRLLLTTPLTTDFSRWYAWQGICAVLVLLTLGAYAFWTNLGGRPLWREEG